jgi:hypothetical protein
MIAREGRMGAGFGQQILGRRRNRLDAGLFAITYDLGARDTPRSAQRRHAAILRYASAGPAVHSRANSRRRS